MEEELYKLIFKAWCDINTSVAMTKEQKAIDIIEKSI